MKKLNSQGFILAETLVVSVFLMVLFTMIYSNFFPLIGDKVILGERKQV